jgi:hypothetical protein
MRCSQSIRVTFLQRLGALSRYRTSTLPIDLICKICILSLMYSSTFIGIFHAVLIAYFMLFSSLIHYFLTLHISVLGS